MSNALVFLSEAAEHGSESGGANPYVVGITVLVVLVGSLLALVSFGGGRDHS